jgi:uncharacterized peroxidase-related enzyme
MPDGEAWIRLIGRDEAEGRLRTTYERIAGADGQIDRVLQLHGVRPHTLDAHLALYKATLHHAGNRLPRWFLELVGVAVSGWNGCAYCVAHHRAGLGRLVGDDLAHALATAVDSTAPAARQVVEASAAVLPEGPRLAAAVQASIAYARALTLTPAQMVEADVEALRADGLDDGEILELNQVVGYFAYVNRAVLGLGVTHVGERLGLAPSNARDEADVAHR